MAEIRIKEVAKRYGDTQALHSIDMTVADREFLCLLGASGCGKTTLLRIVAGLVPACSSLDDEAAARMVERLTGVQTALAMLDHEARERVFPQVLEQLADRHSMRHGVISGRATRLLHDAGWWDGGAVERRLSQALSGGTEPIVGAAFVEGFLAGSGTVLVHDAELLDVVDRWLSSLGIDAFDAVIEIGRAHV